MVRNIPGLLLFAAMAAMVVCSGGNAVADDYHYTNLLIGDRAAGMGGAYVGVSDDATGLYYNPAGIVYSSGGNLSASVNSYYDTTKTYKSVIGGNGWERKSSSLLPNYFGIVQPVGKFKVGLSYAVPESITADQDQVFHNLSLSSSIASYNPGVSISSYTINYNEESSVFDFGPSIAMEITNKFSTGLTLYYHRKKTQLILNQIITTTNGGHEITNDYRQTEEEGLRPILGFMWTPVDKFSAGIAISKVFVTRSNTSIQYTYDRNNIAFSSTDISGSSLPGDPGNPSLTTLAKRKYPTEIDLGFALFPTPSLLLDADIKYYTAVSEQNIEQVTNIALGSEYYLDRSWALRGGFYTNFANTPQVSSAKVNQSEHIDQYGATVSMSHFTRNTSVTFGGGYSYGTGDAQIIGGSSKIQDATFNGWMMFLAAAYSY
jgi:long-subunit fatty acid transport protein